MSSGPVRRAAVFTGHFLPNIGGVEIYTWQLWRRLVARGWEVLLVTSDVGGGPPEETLDGIRVLRLATFGPMDGRFPIVLPTRRPAEVWRGLDAFAPGVVVTNSRFMPPTWLGAAYARARRVPRVHIEHSGGSVRSADAGANRIAGLVDRSVGRWVVRSAQLCLGVSRAAETFAASLGAVRTAVLPAGVAAPENGAPGRAEWRRKLGLAEGDVAFLFVGRVVEEKGVFTLLEAWAEVNGHARAHLVIAGAGPSLSEVRARAGQWPRVRILGELPTEQIQGVMLGCDVFVNPSWCAEGGPLTLLEAAATGLPVITTPRGAATDLVRSDRDGFIVREQDPQGLAAAMCAALDDNDGRLERGRRTQTTVLATHGWDVVLESFERQLDEVMSHGRVPAPSTHA